MDTCARDTRGDIPLASTSDHTRQMKEIQPARSVHEPLNLGTIDELTSTPGARMIK